jgi:hypothetical protein
MKRTVLCLATAVVTSSTALVLLHAGAPGSGSLQAQSPEATRAASQADAQALTSPEAERWRQGLPTHWRACLLQR